MSVPTTGVGLTLDPDGQSVDLNDGALYRLMSIDLPEPKVRSLYAGSVDTEGSLPVSEHGYENREITAGLMVFGGDSTSLLSMLSVLKQKQGKINREHDGVLRFTFPDGTAIDFDLLEAQGAEVWQHTLITQHRAEVTLSFVAKPFWRGSDALVGTNLATNPRGGLLATTDWTNSGLATFEAVPLEEGGRATAGTNLATNPKAGVGVTTGWTNTGLATFEAVALEAGGRDQAGTNLIVNPKADDAATPAAISTSAGMTGASVTRVACAWHPGASWAFRLTGTNANDTTDRSARLNINGLTSGVGKRALPAGGGLDYYFSCYVKSIDASQSSGVQPVISWYDASSVLINSVVGTMVADDGADNLRIGELFAAPANAAFFHARLDLHTATALDVVTIDVTAAMFEQASALQDYFDGDSANAFWTGTDNDSFSTMLPPTFELPDGQTAVTAFHCVTTDASGVDDVDTPFAVTADTLYRVSGWVWRETGADPIQLAMFDGDGTTDLGDAEVDVSDAWTFVSFMAMADTAGTALCQFREAATAGYMEWYFTGVLIEENPLLEAEPGSNLFTNPKALYGVAPATVSAGSGFGDTTITREACAWHAASFFCWRLSGTSTGGEQSLRFNPNGRGAASTGVNGIPIDGGSTYTVSTYVKTIDASEPTSEGGYRWLVIWYDAEGVEVSDEYSAFVDDLGLTDVQITAEFVAPASAAFMFTRLEVVTDAASDLLTFEVTDIELIVEAEDRTVGLIGDTHIENISDNLERSERMLDDFAANAVPQPDAWLHVGDVTADEVNIPAHDAAAQTFLDAVGAPWYATPGNHDVKSGIRTYGQFATDWGYAGSNYVVDLTWCRVLMVSRPTGSTGAADIDATTLAWMETRLGEDARPHLIVHHWPLKNTVGPVVGDPNVWASTNGTSNWYTTPDAGVLAVLDAHTNAVAWISGHVHPLIQAEDIWKWHDVGTREILHISCPAIGPRNGQLGDEIGYAQCFTYRLRLAADGEFTLTVRDHVKGAEFVADLDNPGAPEGWFDEEPVVVVGDYFDGDTPNAVWTGAADASSSIMRPAPLELPDGTVVDTAFHCKTTDAAGSDQGRIDFAMATGLDYGASVYVWGVGTQAVKALMTKPSGDVLGSEVTASFIDTWDLLEITGTADETGTARVAVRDSADAGAVEWYFTATLIEQATTLGDYFDGSSDNSRWTGAAHLSTSELWPYLWTFEETTGPVLTGVTGEIPGDATALGRMVVKDLSGNSQWWLKWGLQSLFYDSATSAALYFPASGLSPLGGATSVAGAAGSANANVIRQGTLTPGWQAMLSTQAVSAGAHLTNVGSFEVLARLYMPTANTGAVSVALEWGQGDFRRRTTNDAVDFDANHTREGEYVLVSLGQVHLAQGHNGNARWEGRIIASSTVAGDDLDVDWLALVPITEGSGELSAVQLLENPIVFSAREEFDQIAGALAAKTLPVGGTWAGAGDAVDFAVETAGKTAQRTEVSDASDVTGRFAIAGSTDFTNVLVQVDQKWATGDASNNPRAGVFARYVDVNNYLRVALLRGGSTTSLNVSKRVAGTVTDLFPAGGFPGTYETIETSPHDAEWWSIRLLVDSVGRWFAWASPQGSALILRASGYDAALATGGALATGKPGFYDVHTAAAANTRNYDNFFVFVPTADAAVFASQSLELTHQGAEREDSTGAFWSPVSNVEGDYFKLAPAGREGRVNRLVVKASRGEPETLPDSGIDDLQVQVFATPRGVSIPTP